MKIGPPHSPQAAPRPRHGAAQRATRGRRLDLRGRQGRDWRRRRRAGDVCCSDKQMERTRRQRPANNSTGGHSFSTTVCRAANQLQRFCGSTRHRRGGVAVGGVERECYRSTSSWLLSLFLPLLVRGKKENIKMRISFVF